MSNLINADNPIARYVRETRAEIAKVAWLTFEQARNLSLIVIGVTVTMSFGLGLLDFIFTRLFELILRAPTQ